jgi:predicted membrane protein
MDDKPSMRPSGQATIGLIAIVFGVLFLLDNLNYVDIHPARFWPLILIVYGLVRLLLPGTPRNGRLWGGIVLLVGCLFLLHTLDISDIGFRELWPLLLVIVGASLIWGRGRYPQATFGKDVPPDSDSIINGFAVLGGFHRSSNSQDFRGGELSAVMGGCEVDLRQAAMKEPEAVLNLLAIWGGIKLRVPNTWSVSIQGTPLLGGYDDKTIQPTGPGARRLIIKGTALMGGIEITN